MIIGNITNIASVQANLPNAVYLASILAIFNSGGRVAAGILSDKIGGVRTLLLAFLLQGGTVCILLALITKPISAEKVAQLQTA
ncbi:oxalate/formate antiporter [Vibrio cholerae]|nr:oxalate/formate antiporter [Vibrio cholerae]